MVLSKFDKHTKSFGGKILYAFGILRQCLKGSVK